MKKIILTVVAGILLAQGVRGAVQALPFTDHFTYPQGNLYTVAAGVWDAGGSAGAEFTVQTNAALTGPSGFAASSGNGVRWAPDGTGRRNIVQFSSISSNNVGAEIYVSLLLNDVSGPSSSKLVAYLDNIAGSTVSSPQLGIFLNGTTLGIGKKTSTGAVSTTLSAGAHLVVVRYTILAGNDQVDLWVDPTNTSYNAASPPPSLGSTTGGTDPTNITYFAFNSLSGVSATAYYDEVRISTNWTDVVPGTPPPPPPPPLNAPQVTYVEKNDQGFVMQGIGGNSNGLYEVLASVDMMVPVTNWDAIATHNFDADGSFSITNLVPEDAAYEFFVLRVTETSTNTPPSITSQPQNQQVLEGQAAQFIVSATGSVPLRYQWYFNTNTVLSAGTNATLTISNVQSNDVGGYSVIVSNTAGSVTSVVAFLSLGEPVTNGNYYVSPTGNDNDPGTYSQPFFNLQKAVSLAQPGNTIYVRGGTFFYASTIRITNSGSAFLPINLLAYPGEYPLLDFVNQPYGSSNRAILITTNGNYWYVKGLEVARAGDNGIKVEGSHNTFELCVFHHCGDSGLQIGFAHETDNPGTWGAYNSVLNCDSYMNYDQDNRGSDADGFACKLHPGPGNVFIGCRAWKNSDDGYDLFETDASVVLSNCWAWHSGDGSLYNVVGGSFQGNGNGIKLGGNGAGGSSMGIHYAINCIAFNCSYKSNAEGFTNNSHNDGLRIYNCLGFNNGSSGYNFFIEGARSDAIMKNNVSFPRAGSTTGVSIDSGVSQNNTWNLPVSANSSDYGNLTEAAAEAPRGPDGSLPTGFAHLVAGSDLIDQGTDVGQPYCGSAPDLGPFEYCP